MSDKALTYHIWPENPEAHLYRITLTIANPASQQVVSLPAWIPGSYLIRGSDKTRESKQEGRPPVGRPDSLS